MESTGQSRKGITEPVTFRLPVWHKNREILFSVAYDKECWECHFSGMIMALRVCDIGPECFLCVSGING